MTALGLVTAPAVTAPDGPPAAAARLLSTPPTAAFWCAVALYVVALGLLLAALSGRSRFARPAAFAVGAALLAHGVDIGWRGVLHVHPAQSVREAMGFLAFLLTGGYLLASLRQRLELAGVLILPVALVMLLVARLSPAGADPTQLSTILRIHVSLATVGLALFALAATLSIIYLLKDRNLRGRRLDTVSVRGGSGSLESLDRMAHALIWIGFPIFTASIILGAMWLAQQRLPIARPEYPLALTTWVCFATLLAARQVWGWRGRRSAKLTLAGFATALIVLALYLVRRAVGG